MSPESSFFFNSFTRLLTVQYSLVLRVLSPHPSRKDQMKIEGPGN